METKDAVSSPSTPSAENRCRVPPHPLPISRPALALAARPCQHAQMCVTSPCSDSKPPMKFITWAIWAGLSQARTSTISSAIGAHLQGGEKTPQVAGDGRGGGGQVLGSDGKKRRWDLGKRTETDGSRSAISVAGEPRLQHVQYPGKGRAWYFLLNTHSNPLPFWL